VSSLGALNLMQVCVCTTVYILTFWKLLKHAERARHLGKESGLQISLRIRICIILVCVQTMVFADGLIALLSAGGMALPSNSAASQTLFILIHAVQVAVNPFIYTLSTIQTLTKIKHIFNGIQQKLRNLQSKIAIKKAVVPIISFTLIVIVCLAGTLTYLRSEDSHSNGKYIFLT